MSDDLTTILSSIQTTQRNLLARIEALEGTQDKAATRDWGIPYTKYGLCSPVNPPSTSVHVGAGFIWCHGHYPDDTIFEVNLVTWPEEFVDLSDYASAFTNAYYYRYCILALELRLETWGLWESDEYDNPSIAMRAFYGVTSSGIDLTDLWSNPIAFPVSALLLRNNGTTGSPGEIENVTLHDRTLSSFIQVDVRPWMNITVPFI